MVWGIITLVLVLLSFGPGKTDFALPVFTTFFAVTEAFIIFLCVDMMLGKAVLRVEPGKASLFRGIGPVGSTWDFLLPAQAPIMMERKGGEKDGLLPHLRAPAFRKAVLLFRRHFRPGDS